LDALIAAARAVHFFCALLIFGETFFALAIAAPLRSLGAAKGWDISPRALRILAWSLAGSVAAALVWLAAEAIAMSGLPIEQALGRDTMTLVLGQTTFGRVWLLRLALAIAFAIVLFALRGSSLGTRARLVSMAAVVIAAGYLCTLAWSGHAGAGAGSQRAIQLPSDMLHLLAAGAWLGALPALVRLLGSAPRLDDATQAVRRFSTLGLAAVGVLVVSGVINAWFLVGDVDALIATTYGRLLLVKLAVFAEMIALAAVNRMFLTPRLVAGNGEALRLLRRNAIVETAMGIVVVSIVAVLGITIPAAHESPDRAPMPSSERHMH
jgi:copper resistance protein D